MEGTPLLRKTDSFHGPMGPWKLSVIRKQYLITGHPLTFLGPPSLTIAAEDNNSQLTARESSEKAVTTACYTKLRLPEIYRKTLS